MKYKICLLSNENPIDHEQWVRALKKPDHLLSFDMVSLISDNWLKELSKKKYDLFLLRPPGRTELFKRLYDERVLLISQYFSTPIYPSLQEILIYENKRFLRDWLIVNDLPHPETFVFFGKEEALSFVKNRKGFPLVGKTNIGASGNGVQILNSQKDTQEYINQAFSTGIRPRTGPKLKKGSLIKKIKKAINNKGFLKRRLREYLPSALNYQHNFIILQEYIAHDFEWRCVRIGESFFAHKKVAKDGKASGHLIKRYDPVPLILLDFIKDITEKHGLCSVAVDVFEDKDEYLINEIQCFFGQSDPYQMLVDGKPGRYVFKNNQWVFEPGDFNANESYDLRLEDALKQFEESK
jgi:glutathione synthase/RimK-type ligase-like ATP-grasp enzyme